MVRFTGPFVGPRQYIGPAKIIKRSDGYKHEVWDIKPLKRNNLTSLHFDAYWIDKEKKNEI
jgi:hypothetical protein